MWVVARVRSQGLGNNKESIGEGTETKSALTRNLAFLFAQMQRTGQLGGTSTRQNATILDGVLDSTQTITDSILDLLDGVLVGAYG